MEAQVYTDGSYNASSLPQSTSSWAVTVRDRWLDQNFNSVPSDEHELAAHPAHSAILYGSSVTCARGMYPAELQAIARSLASVLTACTRTARVP
jgi:glycine/serine hydroxymethyltransferase